MKEEHLNLNAIWNIIHKRSSVLKLSRIKNRFDDFRKVGNFSAHNIYYVASRKDIDDIKVDYRTMLEELFNKAGIM